MVIMLNNFTSWVVIDEGFVALKKGLMEEFQECPSTDSVVMLAVFGIDFLIVFLFSLLDLWHCFGSII